MARKDEWLDSIMWALFYFSISLFVVVMTLLIMLWGVQ